MHYLQRSQSIWKSRVKAEIFPNEKGGVHRETPAPEARHRERLQPLHEWLCSLRVYFAFKADSESVWT